MSSGKKRNKCLIYNVMLAENDATDIFFDGGHALAKGFDLRNEPGRRIAGRRSSICGGLNIGHDDPLK